MIKSTTFMSLGLFATMSACGVEEPNGEAVETTVAALEAAINPSGIAESFHTSGAIDRTNPFFQRLGVNQRSCETCHGADQGWTITARASARLFRQTDGLAPLFMLHDSGSRPDADISTLEARKAAWELTLLENGVTRFLRTIPATAEFTVLEVNDPYGFSTPALFSNFRRPTPTANEAKLPHMFWTNGPHDVPTQIAATVGGAARFHLQRVDAVPQDQVLAARDFQLGLFFAQITDFGAGRLDADGATGGPQHLSAQPFHIGINDIQGLDPSGQPFTRKVFNLFDAWEVFDRNSALAIGQTIRARARASIYRGQEVFNNREFNISGVRGLNDLLGQPVVRGTCSTCHNTPNIGAHSVFRVFDIGTADKPNCTWDIPLLTLQNKTTLETRKVCDVGRGLNSGLWTDVGRFRAPPLRGLAARSPYFHDGQAATITDVIRYHDRRFRIGFTAGERKDLAAFLGAL